ncbi:MAG: hypothetical protein OXC27_18345 [Caldilineaceae bacterium]|nr:hypothetical protein [Caldilineaceae bacterium]
MNRFGRTTVSRVILIVVLCAIFRFVVLGLDNIDCSGSFRQILFVCDMGFFVLHILILATVLAAVIPYVKLADKRDRIAVFSTILLIPAVVNALLRILDYGLLNCEGDGYYINESSCIVLFAQLIFLSLPTLAAITFVLAKGWKILVFSRSY